MPYYEAPASGWVAYLFGGEDRSVSDTLIERCDYVANIPMIGKVGSLNISVTVAIVLFDHLRRQRKVNFSRK